MLRNFIILLLTALALTALCAPVVLKEETVDGHAVVKLQNYRLALTISPARGGAITSFVDKLAPADLLLPKPFMGLCMDHFQEQGWPGELLDELGTTKGNISQHLRILEAQGHIVSRKDANRVYYRIADERLGKLVGTLQGLYCPGLTAH